MKIYQTGDPCPCCGKPIRYTDPETLRLFSLAVHLVGLVDVSKLDTKRDQRCWGWGLGGVWPIDRKGHQGISNILSQPFLGNRSLP